MNGTHSQLIGTESWNPVGESMYSIVQRVRWQNYFGHQQFMQLFKNTAVSKTRRVHGWLRPDNPEVIDHQKLCGLARWSKKQLRYSYSDAYVPVINRTSGKDFLNVPQPSLQLQTQIRICTDCASQGVHLVFHQLPSFIACPLHLTPLIEHCPQCNRGLGNCIYNEYSAANSATQCDSCGWGSADMYSVEYAQRERVLSQYHGWLSDIQNVYDGNDTQRHWLGRPSVVDQLAHIHTLLPGPDWLDECLGGLDRIRVAKHRHRSIHLKVPVNQELSNLVRPDCHELWNPTSPQCAELASLIRRLDTRSQTMVSSVDKQIRRQLHKTGDIGGHTRCQQQRVNLSTTPHTLLSKTSWWLWRWCVDAWLPPEQHWGSLHSLNSFSRDFSNSLCTNVSPELPYDIATCSFLRSYLGNHWIEGPGSLLWRPTTRSSNSWNNIGLCAWADRHWRYNFINDLFRAFIGVAGIMPEYDLFKRWEYHIDCLDVEARAIAPASLSIVSAAEDGVVLRTASSFGSAEQVRQWIAADRPGRQLRMLTDVQMQNELFELVGVSEATAQRSKRTSEFWTKRLDLMDSC